MFHLPQNCSPTATSDLTYSTMLLNVIKQGETCISKHMIHGIAGVLAVTVLGLAMDETRNAVRNWIPSRSHRGNAGGRNFVGYITSAGKQ